MSNTSSLNNNQTPLNTNANPTNPYRSPSNNSNRLTSPSYQNYLPNSNINNNQPQSNIFDQSSNPEYLATFQNPQRQKEPTIPSNNIPNNLTNSTLIPANKSAVKLQPS
jgi:hypothetical protein